MEFNNGDGQNQMAPTPLTRPITPISYVSGFEFQPRGFSRSVPVPSFFPAVVETNSKEAFQQELEKEQILRELEKEEIRREIIISEMILARRRELEEEVRREMAEGVAEIPLQTSSRITFGEPISMPFYPTMNHDSLQSFTKVQEQEQNNNKDKAIMLAKPEAGDLGGKRKAMTHAIIDGNENESSSLKKKPKTEWSCSLCKISATSEKALNDHLKGKKHRSKEASLRIPKIGLDSRLYTQNTAAAAASSLSQNNTCYEYMYGLRLE